jgi:hypothetical protein
MRKANLLILGWEDTATREEDITTALTSFSAALNKATETHEARETPDNIFSNPRRFENADFIQLIFNYDNARSAYPWLGEIHYQLTLQTLYFRSSENYSSSLEELDQEFPEQNNGVLCVGNKARARFVFDEPSWLSLHIDYIRLYPEHINWSDDDGNVVVFPYSDYTNHFIFDFVKIYAPEQTIMSDALVFFEEHSIEGCELNNSTN